MRCLLKLHYLDSWLCSLGHLDALGILGSWTSKYLHSPWLGGQMNLFKQMQEIARCSGRNIQVVSWFHLSLTTPLSQFHSLGLTHGDISSVPLPLRTGPDLVFHRTLFPFLQSSKGSYYTTGAPWNSPNSGLPEVEEPDPSALPVTSAQATGSYLLVTFHLRGVPSHAPSEGTDAALLRWAWFCRSVRHVQCQASLH